jgi:hypothetical protein
MAATREAIEATLRALNDAENSHDLSPLEKSAIADQLSSADVRGWANGVDRGGRSAEREAEAWLFTTFPDYHRHFERVVIDPPHAAVGWRITGTDAQTGAASEMSGASILRFDDQSRISEFWLYYELPAAVELPE